jgi:hypothetical protein
VASAQWSHMNWVRSLLALAGVLFSLKGLDTYYSSGTDRRANTKRSAT